MHLAVVCGYDWFWRNSEAGGTNRLVEEALPLLRCCRTSPSGVVGRCRELEASLALVEVILRERCHGSG